MNLISFLLYCIVVTYTPGPTNIAILSISTNFGFKKTLGFIAGAASAILTLLVFSALFNSLLTLIIPKITLFMQFAGCLYMLYLAYQVFKMNVSEKKSQQAATFISGFAMQFINPKVWLLVLTVFPSYIMPYYQKATVLLGFAGLITLIALLSLYSWALFGMFLIRFLQKYQRAVNIILGCLLLYSAVEVSGVFDLIKR